MLPIRKPYRIRSPETWDLIRSAYLRGEGAPHLARVFGVTETNIRKRARVEGWSKRAYAALLAAGEGAGQDLSPQVSADPDRPGEAWTSLKDRPPPSMRRWPQPLPGMGPMRAPAWEPPPGYGPMPPHLVPPVERPEDDAPSPSAAEVADQAIAAAGRAIVEGRYAEAERLGKLAESLRRQAMGGAGAARAMAARPAAQPRFADEEEDEADRTPEDERLLDCTLKTCALSKVYDQAKQGMARVFAMAQAPEQQDVADWADMAEAVGEPLDNEMKAIIAAYRAEGLEALLPHMHTLVGDRPHMPPFKAEDVFRKR